MAGENKDNLCLYLENGRFNLGIIGERANNPTERIITIESPHFYEVLARLCEYHRDCLAHFYNPNAILHRKGGGDYQPKLIEWNLNLNYSGTKVPRVFMRILQESSASHTDKTHNQQLPSVSPVNVQYKI